MIKGCFSSRAERYAVSQLRIVTDNCSSGCKNTWCGVTTITLGGTELRLLLHTFFLYYSFVIQNILYLLGNYLDNNFNLKED